MSTQIPNQVGIQSEVLQHLQKQLKNSTINEQTRLMDEGLIDSLSFVDLLFALEQQYNVEIPLEDIDFEQFASAETIAAFLSSLLKVNDTQKEIA